MRIIGFGHKKRTGKDTATKVAMSFVRQYRPDLRTHVLSFGNVIKDFCYHLYAWGGLQRAHYYENNPDEIEQVLPRIGKSPRQIWDTVGLMGREISGRTWVELALKDVDADLLISKDVRGLEEFDLIKEAKGLAIRMNRKAAPKGGPVDDILNDAPWDMDIDNNGTQRELCDTVKSIVQTHVDLWFPKGK